MSHSRRARVIAVASGKGGLGRSTLAANLGVTLALAGRKPLLVDLDFGLADAAILLGINAAVDLDGLAAGTTPLSAMTLAGPAGLDLIPGGPAGETPRSRELLLRRLAQSMRPLADRYDDIVVDTTTGAAPDVIASIGDSDGVILLVGEEPTAFMNAYGLLRLLAHGPGISALGIVAAQVEDETAGAVLFQRFAALTARFLPVQPSYLGAIPMDSHVKDSVVARRPCVQLFPDCPASLGYRRVAGAVAGGLFQQSAGGDRFLALESVHAVG
jgi:flagellar biosynthesis protein FlhG